MIDGYFAGVWLFWFVYCIILLLLIIYCVLSGVNCLFLYSCELFGGFTYGFWLDLFGSTTFSLPSVILVLVGLLSLLWTYLFCCYVG